MSIDDELDNYNSMNWLTYVFILLFVIGCIIAFILWIKKEGFENQLDYPLSNNGYMPYMTHRDLSKYKPVHLPPSYDQITNNYKFWANPENGSAVNPHINGLSIYGFKPSEPTYMAAPPEYDPGYTRVNYYYTKTVPFL